MEPDAECKNAVDAMERAGVSLPEPADNGRYRLARRGDGGIVCSREFPGIGGLVVSDFALISGWSVRWIKDPGDATDITDFCNEVSWR